MCHEDGTEMQRRDKGKQKMEVTTTQNEDSTAQLEVLLMFEKQLEELQQIEKQHAEVNAKLLEESVMVVKKQLEELNQMLEKQHDRANTKLLEELKGMLGKKLEELEHMLQKQHGEANTMSSEEPKRMLGKHLEVLEQMLQKQHDDANTKLLREPIRMFEKQLEELKLMLEKQHDEANTKLSEEHKRMLEKQLKELERMLKKQDDEARTKLLEEHKRLLEKQHNLINGLQTTAFQLTNYYFVSQAVVFTALAGDSSSFACHDVWFPLVLSLVPAILNLCALGLIRSKYRKAIKHRDKSTLDYERLVVVIATEGVPEEARHSNKQMTASGFDRKSWDAIFFDACLIVFFLIALVIAFGSYWRLCRRKHF